VPLTTGQNLAQSSRWRGRWADISGYIWLGARYYDPESGSFLSGDPLWNGGDPNYYTFCGGDPINSFDASGTIGSNFEIPQLREAPPTLSEGSIRARDIAGGFIDEFHGNIISLAAPWSLEQLDANAAGFSTFESRAYNNMGQGFREMYGNPMAKLGVSDPNSQGAAIGEMGADMFTFYTMIEGLGSKDTQVSPGQQRVLQNILESQRARNASSFEQFYRRGIARDFYDSAGWSPKDVSDHISGIDFSQPVDMDVLRAGQQVVQYQRPSGPIGNYFGPIGSLPTELGISGVGRLPTLYAPIIDTPVLRSTAAAVMDTWSLRGESFQTKGGSIQYFAPINSVFRAVNPSGP